ncbi:MAG: hypothetical protein ACXVAM_08965 [Vulcanimicrobiaceae bacterium]
MIDHHTGSKPAVIRDRDLMRTVVHLEINERSRASGRIMKADSDAMLEGSGSYKRARVNVDRWGAAAPMTKNEVKGLGVDIPESDYNRLRSLKALTEYLATRVRTAK